MFWKKKAPPEEAPTPTPTPVNDSDRRVERAEAELDTSLEAAASMLRALAKHSFPVGEEPAESIAKRLEAWASHILVLAPVPDEPEGARPERREWARLVRFVGGHRKREQEHVVASISAMRDAIVTMLQCFGTSASGQAKSDKTLTEHVTRLRAIVETGSIEQLRQEALAVSEAVQQALEEQRERAREQTEQLRTKLATLRDQLDAAQRDGETDPLTKLFNRRAFDAALERGSLMAGVGGRAMSLLLVDIDHFKLVNDRHGHPAGDAVLREFSNVLTRCFPRRSDVVARYGGEEFAIILTETAGKDAHRLAGRFLDTVRALRVEHGALSLNVTASVGVAELAEGESGAELLARTDLALYQAKNTGRDRVVASAASAAPVAPAAPVASAAPRPSGPVRLAEPVATKQRAAS
jgi:diguanylate cyclase (GGDEF)-like protein